MTCTRQTVVHPLILASLLLVSQVVSAASLEPGAPLDYSKLAFNPDRWETQGVSTQLTPWEGDQLVFITTTPDLDREVMTGFVTRLEMGWQLYEELTGRPPRLFKQWHGKPTITAIPSANRRQHRWDRVDREPCSADTRRTQRSTLVPERGRGKWLHHPLDHGGSNGSEGRSHRRG